MMKWKNIFSAKYSLVDDYLVRGPHPNIISLIWLKKTYNINQIYDFRHLSKFHFKFIEKINCKLLGIKYKSVPYSNIYGRYPDLQVFENVAYDVKQNGLNGGRTLFHCNSGRHRTAHFSAFYKLTHGEPLAVIKDKMTPNEYTENVINVINDQIINYDYFSRSKIQYNGLNPIKRMIIRYNNLIVIGLQRAHSTFINRLIK